MLGFLAFATSKLHLTKFHFRKRLEKLNQRCENECQLTSEFFPKKKEKKICIFREIDVEFSMHFDLAKKGVFVIIALITLSMLH